MLMRRGTTIVALGAVVAFGFAGSAPAATVALGPGASPSLAMDDAGTAYVAYAADSGPGFCRLPRRARACDVRAALPGISDPEGPAYLVRRQPDGALFVVQGGSGASPAQRGRAAWLWSSGDGGRTWAGPALLSTGVAPNRAVRLSPDGAAVFLIETTINNYYAQYASLAAGETRVIDLNLLPDGSNAGFADNAGEAAWLRDGRLMAAIGGTDTATVRTFVGGDPFAQGAWSPWPAGQLPGLDDPQLAAGPGGTYLLERRSPRAQLLDRRAPFAVRRYGGSRFGGPRSLAGDREVLGGGVDADQDAAGRLHVAWGAAEDTRACVVYARTGKRARGWFGRSTTIARFRSSETPRVLRLGTTGAGRGVAAWEGGPQTAPTVNVTTLRQRKGRYRAIGNPFARPRC